MNKLRQLLERKSGNLLNIYCTAGYPQPEDLPVIVDALAEAGADMVEVGMPYSDPIADGPTIQWSNSIALANGITTERIFGQLGKCTSSVPKILMGYYNPVLQYGMERFCRDCAASGVDGVILPDLPFELWARDYAALFRQYDLSMIFLVTPATSESRIRRIDELSTAFIYAVTQTGTTGKSSGVSDAGAFLERLRGYRLNHPVLAGFSISRPEDFALVCSKVSGGIVGSAFIRHLASSKDVARDTRSFVTHITSAIPV
jgi:tryptophan synthase alpha chain